MECPWGKGSDKVVRNINLKLNSNPPGATVYLVPKLIWERTPLLAKLKNENLLGPYKVYNGITPIWTRAQEYVYVAVFKYKNQFVRVECSPTYTNPIDSVYADFTTK